MELIKALVSNSRNSKFFCSFSEYAENFDLLSEIGNEHFHIRTYRGKISFVLRSVLLPITLLRLAIFLIRNQIELVYVPMAFPWFLPILPILKLCRIPYVLTVHDGQNHYGEGLAVPHLISRIYFRNAYRIVTLSQFVRKQILSNCSVADSTVFVSKLGYFGYKNLDRRPKVFSLHSPMRIVFYGRIRKYKGLEYFLKAVCALEKIDPALRFELYGSGDLSAYEDLLQQVSNIRVENRWLRDDEVCNVFASPCINVCPYIEASQSGVVPVALSCGIPTICTAVGGLAEQVVDGVTGYVVDCADVERGIVNRVLTLQEDPERYNEMSRNCIRYADAELSWDRIAGNLIRFLEL